VITVGLTKFDHQANEKLWLHRIMDNAQHNFLSN